MKYKLGLLGEHIGYTFSPIVHDEIFRYIGVDAEYKVYDTPKERLEETVAELKKNLVGFNVTKPFKTKIIELLDEDESGCGAVNTVSIAEKTVGYNTDGWGFMKSFLQDCPIRSGAKVLILGAGGAARVVAKMLECCEFDTYVHNRTLSKAEELAKTFGVKLYDGSGADAVVNCTSFGLNRGEDALDGVNVGKITYAFDLIYNPEQTDFLRDAKERHGATTKNGMDMLIYQAIKTDEIVLPDVRLSKRDYEKLKDKIRNRLRKHGVV